MGADRLGAGTPILRNFVFFLVGTIPIGIYYWIVRRRLIEDRAAVSESTVDSVYYLGFLITLATLLSTVITYGVLTLNGSKDVSSTVSFIAIGFALSLGATGLALFARVDLVQLRDESTVDGEIDDVLRAGAIKLDEAYQQLTIVMRDATRRFESELSATHSSVAQRSVELIELAGRDLKAFVDTAARDIASSTAAGAEALTTNSAALFKRMADIVEEMQARLSEFLKAATLEASSSALSFAVSEVSSSLGKASHELLGLCTSLESLATRSANAVDGVNMLGGSGQVASKAIADFGLAVDRVSGGAGSVDFADLRLSLSQLSDRVRSLSAAASSIETEHVAAYDGVLASVRAKTEDLDKATKLLSEAFIGLARELAESASLLSDRIK